ncbi:FxsA family protein [Halioxenophilus aromaticivorans]|uniref:Membrane protein FxsA n=1 Tax=Halioxenophilus aromaticivorans TaxID=1306992 RepID=A0AAV3TZ26_9ALTE
MPILLIVFFGMFVEFWVIVAIAKQIGVLATLGATLVTAAIGLALVRRQGLKTLARAQEKAQHGESPAREMVEGVAIFFGGILLFVPGFFSDAIGFALLIPGLRGVLGRRFLAPIIQNGRSQFHFYSQSGAQSRTFEGEFERTDINNGPDGKKNQNFLP